MGDWGVTVAEVLNETGETVSTATVAIASAGLEIHLNMTPAASAVMRTRDLHWVKTAIKWQAAWLPGQPDFASRLSVMSQSQDGVSMQGTDESWLTLAPMAKRALKNVSWKGWRTIKLLDERYRLGKQSGMHVPFSMETSDELWPWTAL